MTSMKPRLLEALDQPWAITREKLVEIRAIYLRHLGGEKIDIAAIEARIGEPLSNDPERFTMDGDVAIVPIHGVIMKRANMFTKISGGVSTQLLEQDLAVLRDDPLVRAVVLDIDSPGGTVDGTPGLMQAVRDLNAAKPVVAFSDGVIASAAYWIGSAASEIYIASEVVQAGSIGVIATHEDRSEANRQQGVSVTHITAGRYKAIESPDAPLSDEARAEIQSRCDYLYGVMVRDIAENRSVSASTVLERMAEGRIFIGAQAIEAGLVDGVSTLDSIVANLNRAEQITEPGDGGDPARSGTDDARASIVNVRKDDMKIEELTVAQLTAQRQDLIDEIRASVLSEHDAATEAALAAAVEAERERIRGIEAHSMPGCEELIARLKWDPKVSAESAAGEILKHLRESQDKRMKALAGDAPDPVPHQPPTDDNANEYEALVAEAMSEGLSRSAAIRAVVEQHPGAHRRYIQRQNAA